MRIRFRSTNGEEALAWDRTRAKIDQFWAQVRADAALAIERGQPLQSLEGRVDRAVRRVDAELAAEIDETPAGPRLVVLSGENPSLDPLLAEMLARAPVGLPFHAARHREPVSVADAAADVRRRVGVDVSTARVRIGFSRSHLLDAVVFSPNTASATDERALDAANLLLRRLFGDEAFDTWIGAVDVAPMPRPSLLRVVVEPASSPATLSIDDAEPALRAAIRGAHGSLPDDPWCARPPTDEWTVLEGEPILAEDYARQDDLVVSSTQVPEAMKCFLEGGRFSSLRFSKCGERFAYVKIDAQRKTPEERQSLRLDLEQRIDAALRNAKAGAIVGGGLGARYVYVHLAFAVIDEGIAVTREVLRGSSVDPRAWILFCDSEWAGEWVGIWGDAPPP
jgi:hypothetical protein